MKITEGINKRWSPRAFADKMIDAKTLVALFGAAGSAPSAFNEQPWRYIVGVKGDDTYDLVKSCLVEFNQDWASTAPVIMLGIASNHFQRNQKLNAHSWHDLGAATSYLTIKAIEHNIYVHQMGGFSPEKAREVFNIPEGYEAVTAIALGYIEDLSRIPESMHEEEKERSGRKSISEFVFGKNWADSKFD